MKKLLSLFAVLCFAFGANAQTHTVKDFLNVRSVMVSNAVHITNLYYVSGLSNRAGILYTNREGSRLVTLSTGTNTLNFLGTVDLPNVDRNGTPHGTNFNWSVGIVAAQATAEIGSLNFVFAPVYGGERDVLGNTLARFIDSTAANMSHIQVTNTAQVTTPFLTIAGLPTGRWPGAKSVALFRVTSTNATASAGWSIFDVKAFGYVP